MTFTPWRERSPEEARLLNPGFVGLLLAECTREYQQVNDSGLPYTLTFVVAPIVLHKPTRDALPRTVRTSLASWLSDNTRVQVGFVERARALVPCVKEAIMFASNADRLVLDEAHLKMGNAGAATPRPQRGSTTEVRDCVGRARFVGKWLANSGDHTTVMALWGIRP